MTCCPPGEHAATADTLRLPEDDAQTLFELSRDLGDGKRQLDFAVPDAHCAACIRSIESGLSALPMVANARVNLSKRRVSVVFDPRNGDPAVLAPAIRKAGYRTSVLDPKAEEGQDRTLGELLRSLAVAGVAAGNIMLFSISVWSGADAATRDLFHWISALIAIPAIAYAGQVFFRSAWHAVRAGTTNMDVPISIGLILATLLSLYETTQSSEQAYFDASTTLLFFLLAGRVLDHIMRERARSAANNLARLSPRGAIHVAKDGSRGFVALADIVPGMVLALRAGERVPVDGVVTGEAGAIDNALVTGESLPVAVNEGDELTAGAINVGGPLTMRATRASADSFLARMAALMDAAESARTGYRRLADRISQYYAPVVHTLAAATFGGWGLLTGDWHTAILNAVAVLIITCPCALALAVPIAHVVAAGRLFEQKILMRDGAALERAAEIDTVIFDKTGTLTIGEPRLMRQNGGGPAELQMAASLAAQSSHPLSRALAEATADRLELSALREVSGEGMEAEGQGHVWRLGNAEWCNAPNTADGETAVFLSRDGEPVARFDFADALRPDAEQAIAAVRDRGYPTILLSGDRAGPVAEIAGALTFDRFESGLKPDGKQAAIATLREQGHRPMMVGDGINDAPALRAAHVSMAPGSAADIGRSAADFVFTGNRLDAVPFTLNLARRAARIVRQNLVLALGYNLLAVPLAVTGHVTPLIAAIAMSSSSLIVVLNAMRLGLGPNLKAPVQPAFSPVEIV